MKEKVYLLLKEELCSMNTTSLRSCRTKGRMGRDHEGNHEGETDKRRRMREEVLVQQRSELQEKVKFLLRASELHELQSWER